MSLREPDLRGTEPVTAYAALRRLRITATLRRPGFARSVASTPGFNFAATAAGGLGGIIIARVVGPTVRGEYSAITAWMGVLLLVGGMGQPAALVYYVAREPLRAREYVATSRVMMLATGMVVLVAGVFLAPVLGHGLPAVTAGYRIAFGALIVAFVGGSFTASLQGRELHLWNVVRVAQPALSLTAIVVLWRLRRLTLDVGMIVIAATMLLQLVWAYRYCRRTGPRLGARRVALVRRLLGYGTAQIAALAPATLNTQVDQLVPRRRYRRPTWPLCDRGLGLPTSDAAGHGDRQRSIASPGGPARGDRRDPPVAAPLGARQCRPLAAAMLVPLAAVSYWMVPLVFGAAHRGAVPLLWVLTPGSVFLACGQVTGDLLRGRRHPAVVAWAEGIAAIFTVALLFALLPLVGGYGAVVASTISYGVALAVMLRRLSRLPRHSLAGTAETAIASPGGEGMRVMRLFEVNRGRVVVRLPDVIVSV